MNSIEVPGQNKNKNQEEKEKFGERTVPSEHLGCEMEKHTSVKTLVTVLGSLA